MSHSPAPAIPQAPTPHTVTGTNFYPAQRIMEIHTRGPLAIKDQVTVVSFDVIEALFLTVLQMSLATRGITVALGPKA